MHVFSRHCFRARTTLLLLNFASSLSDVKRTKNPGFDKFGLVQSIRRTWCRRQTYRFDGLPVKLQVSKRSWLCSSCWKCCTRISQLQKLMLSVRSLRDIQPGYDNEERLRRQLAAMSEESFLNGKHEHDFEYPLKIMGLKNVARIFEKHGLSVKVICNVKFIWWMNNEKIVQVSKRSSIKQASWRLQNIFFDVSAKSWKVIDREWCDRDCWEWCWLCLSHIIVYLVGLCTQLAQAAFQPPKLSWSANFEEESSSLCPPQTLHRYCSTNEPQR